MRLLSALLTSFTLLAPACGDLGDAEDLAADPQVTAAPEGSAQEGGKEDGLRLTVLTSVAVPSSVGTSVTRHTFTTAASFKRFFGVNAPVDFSRRWVAFYSAGTKPTTGYTASIARVALSSSGRTLEVTTRLASPGAGCAVGMSLTKPTVLVSFAKPSPAPGAVRYYTSNKTAAACTPAGLCGSALNSQLSSLTDGLLWMSEEDLPISYVELTGAGSAAMTAPRLLSLLGLPATTPVEALTLDQVLTWIDEDPSLFDDAQRVAAERFRAVKAALRQNLTNITVWKLNKIEVDVYVLGNTSCGDVAGLKTRAIET